MMLSKYTPIIGLEVHVELKTQSKMFCGCRNDPFHASKPNIYTCPVCLGLPGALPVPNKKAIEWTVKLGLALGCTINEESKFDRKHYFYPDLPKGYQISQYDEPFATNGELQVTSDKRQVRKIRIRRVHLEEDTGKLLHRKLPLEGSDFDPSSHGEDVSLIDFNRSGVPLVEIVTEPDIRSAEEAKVVTKKMYDIVRFLEISDADMEKGSMRLEANVSLIQEKRTNLQTYKRTKKQTNEQTNKEEKFELPNYKVELKNINSFRFLEKAIMSELERQQRLLENGEKIHQETRGWDESSGTTKPQRTKEEAADYRYFPEPDIPPIRLTAEWISKIKNQISTMPDQVKEELVRRGVSDHIASVVASDLELSRCYQNISDQPDGIIQGFLKWLQHHKEEALNADPFDLLDRYTRESMSVVSDEMQLSQWVDEALQENSKAVKDYQEGKTQALQALIGAVQRRSRGKADIKKVPGLLLKRIENSC